MKRTEIKTLIKEEPTGQEHVVKGWVRNKRESKQVVFVNLNDGSVIHDLQVVADAENFDDEVLRKITIGACLSLKGELVASQGGKQNVELKVSEIEILGESDPNQYPLQPKEHSMEFLREIAHLRPRTKTFSAILRIRHAVSFAIHKFFNDNGFFYLHTPIITGSDAEGAGEMFRVTTLDAGNPPKNEDGSVDFTQDFFEKEANLTVSGQLEGELGAMALSKVYTFGPTFRAENSNTSRHLAEFWMVEPEMAFYDIHENMDLAESFLKYLIQYTLENCEDDLAFLAEKYRKEEEKKKKEQRSEMGLFERLKFIQGDPFARITHKEAVEILMDSKPHKKNQFQFPVEEGMDLQSEHERFLVEKHFKKPVIITDYPADIKAFYMKVNEGGDTVRAMDILFPQIGEIVGGSEREERYDVLKKKCDDMGIRYEDVWWYLDTRRFGTAPHSGFGLGFERFILFLTGMGNVRDVIPFPRTPGSAEF